MTRKDYKLIAEVFDCLRPVEAQELRVWEELLLELAYQFKEDNENFDRARFCAAAGLEDQ
jgi:hypothetical protein